MRAPYPVVVSVSGEIDILAGRDLCHAVRGAIADSEGVTSVSLDCHDVDFIDGAGVGAVLAARRWARDHDVTVHVTRPSRCCVRLFGILELHHLVAA